MTASEREAEKDIKEFGERLRDFMNKTFVMSQTDIGVIVNYAKLQLLQDGWARSG